MINISGISPYSMCGIFGFILGIIYLFFICKKANYDFDDIIYVYVWAAIGAMIGAKLLYLLIESDRILDDFIQGKVTVEYIYAILSGGFVFYGGLIGSIGTVLLACKYFRLNINDTLSLITPAMPLVHAFGRIGCTIVGCCYGIEITDGIGIVYQQSQIAPLGVKLFPVQIAEALGDIIIFLMLLYFVHRDAFRDKILILYLVFYSVLRFFLEFLRGDLDRGGWWLLSTSQWISIGILLIVAVFVVCVYIPRKVEQELID